jgi:Tol biopolymer transport system component
MATRLQRGRRAEVRWQCRLAALAIPSAVATALIMTGMTASATTPGSNGRIVYATQLDTGHQLMTILPDGSYVMQITNRAQTDSIHPDWSPDGRRIVYEFDHDGTADLALINHDGTHQRLLQPKGLPGYYSQPVFAPHSRRIVFERANKQFNDDSIWVMRRDGSHVRRLTTNPFTAAGYDTDPNVSPDGTVVTFVRIRVPDDEQALFSVHIDGTHLRRLTPYSYDVAIKHDWAPDGKHIVVTVNANIGSHPHRSANVAVMRPDGSRFHLLTHFEGREVNAFAGSYSPNGKWIVYRTETGDGLGTLDGGLFGLYKKDALGGRPQLIASLIGRPRYIDWGSRPA